MKSIKLLAVVLVMAFVLVPNNKGQTSFTASSLINGFLLKLESDASGKCVLSYKKESKQESQTKTVALDMDAPCEFMRLDTRILSYSYGKKEKRRRVVIIVGGKPDPNKKDSLMPEGCGTEFIAVSVFCR